MDEKIIILDDTGYALKDDFKQIKAMEMSYGKVAIEVIFCVCTGKDL